MKNVLWKQLSKIVIATGMFIIMSSVAFAADGDVSSVTLLDDDNNGIIDQVALVVAYANAGGGGVACDALSDSSVAGFVVTDAGTVAAVTVASAAQTAASAGATCTVTLTLTEGANSSVDTSATAVDVVYTPGTLAVTEGANPVAVAAILTGVTEVDAASPVVTAVTFTTNTISSILYDAVTIAYSEAVEVSTDAGGDVDIAADATETSTATLGGMTTIKQLDGIGAWDGASDMDTSLATGNEVTLSADAKTITVSINANTAAEAYFNAGSTAPTTPTFTPIADATDIADAANNPVNTATVVATNPNAWDVAGPTITSVTVSDADNDGKIETGTVVFSESILDASVTNGDATLGTSGTTTGTFTTGTANDATTVFARTDDAAIDTAYTVATSDFIYDGGTTKIRDWAGNLLNTDTDGTVITADIVETDGASPILTAVVASAGGGKNKLAFTYSEAMTLSGCTGTTVSSATCGDLTTAGTFVGLGNFVTNGTIEVPTTKNTLAGSGTATITVTLAGETGGLLTSSVTPPSGNIAGSPAAGIVDANSNQVATPIVAAANPLPVAEWELTAPTVGPTFFEKGGVSATGDYFRWTAIADPSDFGFYMILFSITQSDVTGEVLTSTTEWTSAGDAALATLATAITTVTNFSSSTDYYVAAAAVDTYGNVSPESNTIYMTSGGTGPGSVIIPDTTTDDTTTGGGDTTADDTTADDTTADDTTADDTTADDTTADDTTTDEDLYEEVVVVTEAGETITLSDVGGHWAEDEVQAMVEQEIVTGNPDGSFKPSGQLNRAEAAALLYRVLGLGDPEAPSTAPFTDVLLDAWYAGYVSGLKALGLVNGNPDGTYEPGESINRAEFLTLAMNVYYYVSDEDTQAAIDALKEGDTTDAYEDLVDAWYTEVVTAATELGFVSGSVCGDGMCFNAENEITRAEATVVLYNMFYTYLTVEDEDVADDAAADDAAADDAAADDDAADDDAAADDAAADDAAADDTTTE